MSKLMTTPADMCAAGHKVEPSKKRPNGEMLRQEKVYLFIDPAWQKWLKQGETDINKAVEAKDVEPGTRYRPVYRHFCGTHFQGE